MGYIYYNPIKFSDNDQCISRAFSAIFGIDTIYDTDELRKNWRNILLNNGFKYNNIIAKPFSKRETVCNLAASNNSKDILICSTTDHVVAIIGNYYYDNCDSGDKCVFYFFRKEMT